MKEISVMTDYLAVQLVALAREYEARFAECLTACPRTAEGVIRIDNPIVFNRLLSYRLEELLLALAGFEAYLAFYAAETLRRLEPKEASLSLAEYLKRFDLLELFGRQSGAFKRRHEHIMEEFGRHPLAYFFSRARLGLEEKFIYWALLRTGKLLSAKDAYVKKLFRLVNLRDELMAPFLPATHDLHPAETLAAREEVFLHHDLPSRLTPGRSCSDQFWVESYEEGHFLWELLHCYPGREVQEAVQYLHQLDRSAHHFISVIRPALAVDEKGEPLTEPLTRYVLDLNLGEDDG